MSGDDIHGISLHSVWGEKSQDLIQEITDLWKELSISFGQEKPEDRAKQAVFVARNSENKIIAISTAFVSYVNRMKNHMFILRTLVHPDYRIPGLLANLSKTTIEFLESKHNVVNPKCIGVMAVIQNQRLQELRTVHTPSGLTFIGFSPEGFPIRAYFFKKAKF